MSETVDGLNMDSISILYLETLSLSFEKSKVLIFNNFHMGFKSYGGSQLSKLEWGESLWPKFYFPTNLFIFLAMERAMFPHRK